MLTFPFQGVRVSFLSFYKAGFLLILPISKVTEYGWTKSVFLATINFSGFDYMF